MTAIRTALQRALGGADLTSDEMRAAVGELMEGRAEEIPTAALLTALRIRGETADEIVGAARAMRERAEQIPCEAEDLIDTCGTGGDGLGTFNISTATAIIVAACGMKVAKHGNRSVSSRSGSADVLEALDVQIGLSPAAVGRCIDEVGIGFCFAPLVHGAMKHAVPIRKALGFPTIFNLLGPLTNPAGAKFQLLGANRTESARKLAGALANLGTTRSVVVCGADELDEVALWGETAAFVVEGDKIDEQSWTPKMFGLESCQADDLRVENPEQSANVIRAILSGEHGPARSIVVANTAAALFAAGRCDDLKAGVATAAEAIDRGIASETLTRLIALTTELAQSSD
ncbi:anthranilate phosphoribosyltransferase [Stratiformator vulcanicus]|uniref:Anthranilate phosphoribosyltransferase n=1 Tax=Stratiformator vulcanicus TaxID=2527980 RepID=A0A517QYY8_9PLAN|nr:anthranilate phosphoribosyltransferase [Stratiformator vulcanicus]QDT36818.1 Anthranilate phosphoribosyltransferase [Stratiformator vulcanicus]